MKIGFIGLGNVGSKLAGSLIRNDFELVLHDLNAELVENFVKRGASAAQSAKQVAEQSDIVITCLPSPDACSKAMEADDGVIAGLSEGKVWLEMSTTDQSEVKRIGALLAAKGAFAIDCPVSGGCHRADTGNISIFAGGDRQAFEIALPLLTTMGRRVIHTGELGSASILKVITNYLATAHLAALSEAWLVSNKMGMDPNVAYEAIKASSGNSFVHETESQVILNGSRDISFTMDLVLKDISLFDSLANQHDIPLEISPLLIDIFKDGQRKYGPREWSSNIIRRLEDACDEKVLGVGFPDQLTDHEQEEPGAEIIVEGRSDR